MTDQDEPDDRVHVTHFPPTHTLCGEEITPEMEVIRLYDDQPSLEEGCGACMVRRREITGRVEVP